MNIVCVAVNRESDPWLVAVYTADRHHASGRLMSELEDLLPDLVHELSMVVSSPISEQPEK